MKEISNFYTLKGYHLLESNEITSSMEDYLEMIYRLYMDKQLIRINTLAQQLNVKSSSASKMVSNLKKYGFVDSEKYGIIQLTEKGLELGEYLLYRHDLLHKLFCIINDISNELEQVEKVEHFIDTRTIHNLKNFIDRIDDI